MRLGRDKSSEVVSHPCDINKDVARVGHPGFGFVVSHPCDRKKSQGWGTGHLGYVVSHPSDKNKIVARVGPPGQLGRDEGP